MDVEGFCENKMDLSPTYLHDGHKIASPRAAWRIEDIHFVDRRAGPLARRPKTRRRWPAHIRS